MKILNKIRDCIFATKVEKKYSKYPNLRKNKLSEEEKIERKLHLLERYLQDDTAHERINHEIHKLIKQIESGYKFKL